MARCWECEATIRRPIVVTIGVPPGHPRPLPLCPSCYETHYLPLVAELAADAAHRDPPIPRRRAPGVRRAL